MKKLWKANVWFWKESYSYIKPWKLKDYLYAPIAWFKFMKYEILGGRKIKVEWVNPDQLTTNS